MAINSGQRNSGQSRAFVVIAVFTAIFLLYAGRLFYMQVLENHYRDLAGDRVKRTETIYPERGLIYDRNGELIVYNEPIYNLMVVPRQVPSDIDTARFCELFSIDRETFESQLKKAKRYSYRKPSNFIKEITGQEFAAIEDYLYQFPGFYPEVRTIRRYPHRAAAHVLGFVGEVGQRDIEQSEGYYRPGDNIGRDGVEKAYESVLRGERGVRHVLVDQFNRNVGRYREGTWDTAAVRGQDLTLSLDIELQQYGEKLLRNKKGSIVAIEPSTGQILALISSPSYDPNLLVGRQRGANYESLQSSNLNPINNRALQGYYPPGSIFKPLMALMALEDDVVEPNHYVSCNSGYQLGRLRVGCHAHKPVGTAAAAIQHSCNAWFCDVFKDFIEQDGNRFADAAPGFQHWRDYLTMYGLGDRLGLDLPGEIRGNVPTVEDYNKDYGERRWKASTILTLGIGQDKLIVTPLQQANMMAAIANGGWWYAPHVVKHVEGNDEILENYLFRHESEFDPSIFPPVIDGLRLVVESGTGQMAQVPGIEVCGKTGTAENPHGEDHSVFVAFAPKDNPKIAIAAIVENSGWGGTWSAPICGLMIEKYINREIDPSQKWKEERMLQANFIEIAQRDEEEGDSQ